MLEQRDKTLENTAKYSNSLSTTAETLNVLQVVFTFINSGRPISVGVYKLKFSNYWIWLTN